MTNEQTEAREALIELIDGCIPDDIPGYRQRYTDKAADAILARFNVTERDEGPWEYRCKNTINVSPCAPGHRCEGGRVERRHPASEWEAFDE